MKKLVLLTCLMSVIAFFSYSQSLSLIHDGSSVPNGGSVVYTGEPSSIVIESHIGVTNNGSSTLSVLCKKIEVSLITGSVNTFCWDNCYPPNIYVSLGSLDIAPGETNDLFIGEYQPLTHAGQSVIMYVFYDMNNSNDSVGFNSLFNAYPVGIEDQQETAALSNAYPNPAFTQASFNYSVGSESVASLLVRNVLGTTVKEVPLTGSGVARINTMDLSEGIYFYTLVVNGQTQLTRKLVVSR